MQKWLIALMIFLKTPCFSSWGPITVIFNDALVYTPYVGIDANGDSVIAFTSTFDYMHYSAKAISLCKGKLGKLHTFTQQGVEGICNLSVNATGNAALLWLERDSNTTNFYINASFLYDNTWSYPTTLSDPKVSSVMLDALNIHIDAANQATAVWSEQIRANGAFAIQVKQGEKGNWQPTQALFPYTMNFLPIALLAANTNGQALVSWPNLSTNLLQAAYFDGENWITSYDLSSHIFTALFPQIEVAMNAEANAMILWQDEEGNLLSLCETGGTYETPQPVYTFEKEKLVAFTTVLDPQNNPLVLLVVSDTESTLQTLLAMAYLDNKWQLPTVLDTTSAPDVQFINLYLQMEENGNALAVWEKLQGDETGQIYASTFSQKTLFFAKPTLLSNPEDSAKCPCLAMNSKGQAVVVWIHNYTDVVAICGEDFFPQSDL